MCGAPAREAQQLQAVPCGQLSLAGGHRGAEPPRGGKGGAGTFWREESCKTNSAQRTTTLIPDKAEIALVIPEKPNLGTSVEKLG